MKATNDITSESVNDVSIAEFEEEIKTGQSKNTLYIDLAIAYNYAYSYAY